MTVNDIGLRDHRRAVGEGDRGTAVLTGGIAVRGEGNSLVDDEFRESECVLVCSNAKDERIARLDILLQAD